MHHKPLINLMEKGLELFHQGEISEAILCFESHLQNVDLDDSDAWLMLGKCHAESDEDRKAIGCLERSLAKNPNSSSALLALGVSCVNELLHERALLHLKNWIIRHPKYTNMMKTSIPQSIDGSSESLALDELKQMLKLALDSDTSSDAPKCADVLEAMGILCNVSREYDDAANYFREALHQRNDDHQLWNKLGATLANSNHSDDALHAYREALSLKPKYARAWLNMAIAHSNLQNHEEAARCYLQTLSLNSLATHVWNYLRISLTALERWDLMPLIAARDIHQFHNHFDFVEF
jgi:peroxin-5